jgi:hypothetical protein
MSIFPTRILLATDGSEEATLAAATAADIADKTASELHVVYAEPIPAYGEFPSGRFEFNEAAENEVRNRAQKVPGRAGQADRSWPGNCSASSSKDGKTRPRGSHPGRGARCRLGSHG